jgi:hypothetical protein
MERWWDDIWQEKTEFFGQNPTSMLLCSSQTVKGILEVF